MAGRPTPKMPRRLRIYNPVLGILHVEGTPEKVAKWHIDNPPNMRESPWDNRRQVQQALSGTNGHTHWQPLYGIWSSWWGKVICHTRIKMKVQDTEQVEEEIMTRSREVVKSSAVPSTNKESDMPRTKTKKSKDEIEEIDTEDDELEGLEAELEELEDDDEPDVVDEDDDDEEDDDLPTTLKGLRALAKEQGIKGYRKMDKDELTEAVQNGASAEDEDDEEEEDEEPEEKPKAKKSRSKKSKAKPEKASSNGKSTSKKSKRGAKKGGAKPGTKTSELGGVGVTELAEAAGAEPRDVRNYLRKNEIEKDEESGRYRWPSEKNKEFQKIVKALKD